jgi:hypothetical protein
MHHHALVSARIQNLLHKGGDGHANDVQIQPDGSGFGIFDIEPNHFLESCAVFAGDLP